MSTVKLASRGWYYTIGKATELLHQEGFPRALLDAFQRAFTYDVAVILIYPTDSIPLLILEEDFSGIIETKGAMHHYLEGIYLLDPFYQISMQQPEPGLYSLKDIAPDHFQRSDFFRRHFVYINLKDEVNFIQPIEGVGTVAISIGCSRRFSKFEMERFRIIEPWVLSIMKCHWGNSTPRQHSSAEDINLHNKLTASFQDFGRTQLTDRECDIAQLILKGHSSKSAAIKLFISDETVKVHRRNIYKKLDIKSQSELFSLFLNALVTQEQNSIHVDPLKAYQEKPSPS